MRSIRSAGVFRRPFFSTVLLGVFMYAGFYQNPLRFNDFCLGLSSFRVTNGSQNPGEGTKDVATIEKVGFGGPRYPDSSPFALAGRRISWFSSLVHEGKAATIC